MSTDNTVTLPDGTVAERTSGKHQRGAPLLASVRQAGYAAADDAQLFADPNSIDRIAHEAGALIIDVQADGKLAGKAQLMGTEQHVLSDVTGPLHVVPLGWLYVAPNAFAVVLRGRKEGFALSPESHELILSIDSTVSDRSFTLDEQALLAWLADNGAVSLVRTTSALYGLDMVPAVRNSLEAVEETTDGYRLRATGGEYFEVNEIVGRFVGQIPQGGTLGDFAVRVRDEILGDSDERSVAVEMDASEPNGFERYVLRQALEFAQQLRVAGVLTFESHDLESRVR